MLSALGPPPVTLHTLLTAWQHDPPSLVAEVAEALSVVLYLRGVRRLAHRGRRWPIGRTISFLVGLVLVVMAVQSGLAQYDSVFAAHVVQHVLLMMVAPPLLALGAPVTLAMQASRRPTQQRIVAITHHWAIRMLGNPWVAFVSLWGLMFGYFLTAYYRASLSNQPLHVATHVLFLVTGSMYCWQVFCVDPIRHRLPFPWRTAYVAVGLLLNALLGILIVSSTAPIATGDSLGDTHLGGILLLVAGEAVTVAEIAWVARKWSAYTKRRDARQDRLSPEAGQSHLVAPSRTLGE